MIYIFFRDQLRSGLRFPTSDFFTEVAHFPGVPLTQFHHNSFRIIASAFVLLKIHNLLINSFILYYYFVYRFHEGRFSLTAWINSLFLDDIPSSLKGWKDRYFFLQLLSSPPCSTGFLAGLSTQPELPRGYKFEEPYTQKCNTTRTILQTVM